MKTVLFYSIMITILFSCKKADHMENNQASINNYTITLNNCTTISNLKRTTLLPYGICFDSLIDSRCPQDVQCIWQGYAKVKLRLTIANDAGIPFKLSTMKNPSYNFTPPNDTITSGLKI
jgi:hypothetical protein